MRWPPLGNSPKAERTNRFESGSMHLSDTVACMGSDLPALVRG